MIARRLLTAGRGGGLVDPVGVIRSIVSNVTASDGYVYHLTANNGYEPHTIKVIDDGAGDYVAVGHWALASVYQVDVYSSTDLLNWTHKVTLATGATLPTIGRRSDGSFVVGWSEQSSGRLRFRRYTSLANLFSGTHTDNVLLPKTLATGTGIEQVPNIFDANDPMDIGFAYNDSAANADDRAGRGTLTGLSGTSYTSWNTTAQSAMNAAILGLDPAMIAVGDWERVTYRGQTLTFAEAQVLTNPGPYGAFHVYYWDGMTAVQQSVTTHGGSTEHANISASIVENPSGSGQVLVVGLFLHVTGAASGEAGVAVWYRALP